MKTDERVLTIKKVKLLRASILGSLDGLELDNRDDVIEKSLVIEFHKEELKMIEDILKVLNENTCAKDSKCPKHQIVFDTINRQKTCPLCD